MSEPTLFAEDKGHGTRGIRTVERTLRGWTPHLPEHADLDALWRILPRWCDTDECDGTGRVPTVNEKWLTLERVFFHRACDGRGWLYPDQPEDWDEVRYGPWRAHLLNLWRYGLRIMEDTDE